MLTPIGEGVILQREEEEDEGLIVTPDTAKRLSDVARVISVGPGRVIDGKLEPLEVSVGDRVVINRMAGTEIVSDGQTYLRVNGRDILGIVESADGAQ